MKNMLVVAVVLCVLLIGCASSGSVSETGNYVKNGEFSRLGNEWPFLPLNWNTTYDGGDGFSPIKTEDGRFIGWAENIYSFTLSQNITGLSEGMYNLFAEFRLNPDSEVEDIKMNVYSGSTLIASKSICEELLAAPRETDVMFELTDIEVKGKSVKIEFAGVNILKYIGIDNVVFSK